MGAHGTGLAVDGTVVVVGASLAGLRAAQALREEGHKGRILLVGEEPHPPYDRPPLSKQVLAGTWDAERTALAGPGRLDELGVELVVGHRALTVDPEARRVGIDDGSVVEADGIVLATGARPRTLPGTEQLGAVGVLRTLEDAARVRAAVDAAGPGCRVLVVGAGFIGSEVAATCRGLGCEVTVLEALQTPLEPALGDLVGGAIGALHTRHGVELRTGVTVGAVRAGADGGAEVVLGSGEQLRADVVVVGIGVVANTDWLEGSGIELANGVVCDEALFAADGIVAAGDVCRWRWRHHGDDELVRIEHWEVAAQAGAAAARSLVAGRTRAPAFDPVPYFWSDLYGLRVQVLGRPEPSDEVAVVDGSLDAVDAKFVALYGRRGKLAAALAVSRPRQLMSFRPLLAAGASWHDALGLLAEES